MSDNQRQVDAFETTLRTSYAWIRDFGEALGQTHAGLCYRCLRAGLHAVRDRLPVDECAAFSAQLPLLIRGMWFDGWRPARVPIRVHAPEEILHQIACELEGGLQCAPAAALRATFAVLDRHIDAGELRKVRSLLPEVMRPFWSDAREPASTGAP